MSKRDLETMAETTPTEGTEGGLLREPQVSFSSADSKLTPRNASTASERTRTSSSTMSSISEFNGLAGTTALRNPQAAKLKMQ